jgi:hypothetical protein
MKPRFDVEVLAEAEREFCEAFRWCFERSPIAAEAFRVQVLDAIAHQQASHRWD